MLSLAADKFTVEIEENVQRWRFYFLLKKLARISKSQWNVDKSQWNVDKSQWNVDKSVLINKVQMRRQWNNFIYLMRKQLAILSRKHF